MSDLFTKKGRPWNSIKGCRRFLRTSTWNRAKDWALMLKKYREKKRKVQL